MCGTDTRIFEVMKINSTPFEGLYILETINFQDDRGDFQKLFNYDFFKENGLDTDFKEFYYSVSRKNVIRGMHFQLPPFDHTKLVYVSKGRIKDVVVDIRKMSATYGQCFSIELDDTKAQYLYIPKGFAHGFLSLQDNTVVNYAQTSCYSKEHDCGILFSSIEIDWGVEHPIVSGRDLNFEPLDTFNSPFGIKKNILLTGATGFVGSNFIAQLGYKYNIHLLVRSSTQVMQTKNVFVFENNILTLATYLKENQIDGIVHLASLYIAEHKSDEIRDMVLSNIYLGTALLEAAKIAEVSWFLNTGTIWQNYNVPDYSDIYCPVNLYAASKQAFITIAKYYVETSSIRFCTLKLCDTYGENDTRKKIFALFEQIAASGETLYMSPGEQLLDIVHIDKAIAEFDRLIEGLSDGMISTLSEYVVTSGRHVRLKDLADQYEKEHGVKLNINWGGRPYRQREVMKPYRGNVI